MKQLNNTAQGETPRINRRAVLAGATAILILTASMATSQVVDPHRGWLECWQRFVDHLNTGGDFNQVSSEKDDLEELICTTPAQTVDGILVQIEFTTNECSGFDIGNSAWKNFNGQLFGNVMQSLRETT